MDNVKKVLGELLEIIWGTPPKKKRARDKRGRFIKENK